MKKGPLFVLIVLVVIGIALYAGRSRRPKLPPEPEKIPAIPEKPAEAIKKEDLPRIALVIDDVGYNLRNLEEIFELGVPLTLSILPHLGYSKRMAEEANRKNYEVILHLPLEPEEDDQPVEPSTILCGMEREEVLNELDRAIAGIPHLAGISNHMGSKATKDERLMSIIFERAKDKNLFFMDNLVTPESVCSAAAERIGMGFIRRSVFLDNESDTEYIKLQLEALAYQARNTGWAVGVGHDRPETLAAMTEVIPRLKKEGFVFVFLSDLAK